MYQSFRFLISFLMLSSTLVFNVSALLPIYAKGYRFIQPANPDSEDGFVLDVIGVDYQPGGSSGYDSSSGIDALSDADTCLRDAYILQNLGVNTIRIYTLNPDVNHDACMTILNNAGIYVILDVNSGDYDGSLNRYDPASSYNFDYLTRIFKFIDAFKGYSNVLGFFSGNEVINDEKSASVAGPYIRAVQRDMRQYISKHSNRTIPVGYSAADETTLRLATFQYLQCSINDEDESSSEFFGLNSYEWCSGTSDWETSGYGEINSTFSNSSIPLIFSEYGCNKNSPRTFDEVSDGLYGGLANVFSGGLVYEYSQETSNYGLVQINDNGSVSLLQDYENLKDQFSQLKLTNISSSDVTNSSSSKCESSEITDLYSSFGANFTIPDQPSDITSLIENGVNATNIGQFISDYSETMTNYTIFDVSGKEISNPSINVIDSPDTMDISSAYVTTSSTISASSSSSTSSTISSTPSTSKSKAAGAVAITHNTSFFFFSSLLYMLL